MTSVTAAKRSASVGIQKQKRIANGANASPTMDARPTSDFVTSVIGSLPGQAYARLPPVEPVGTMQRVTEAGAAMREERRFVTALFADLVGSTALGERLEPEELKLVVGDAVGRIVGAVEAFGGTIKDLAGDGVLALFGAPVAHEDDPERALLAGLRIVEEIGEFADEVRGSWGIDGFGVRVGVESGPSSWGRSAPAPASSTGRRVTPSTSRRGSRPPPSRGRYSSEKAPQLGWSRSSNGDRPSNLELKGKSGSVAARPVIAPLSHAGRRREASRASRRRSSGASASSRRSASSPAPLSTAPARSCS